MMKACINLYIADMPETLWALCHQMADVLREEAACESDAHTQERLLEIAADFESGANHIEWPVGES